MTGSCLWAMWWLRYRSGRRGARRDGEKLTERAAVRASLRRGHPRAPEGSKMILKLLVIGSIAVCLVSLAARSHAIRAAAAPKSLEAALAREEKDPPAAIDGKPPTKLPKHPRRSSRGLSRT